MAAAKPRPSGFPQGEQFMNQFIAVIFPDEKKAFEGWRALKELHAEAALTLYGGVIHCDGDGVLLKDAQTEGAVGTAGTMTSRSRAKIRRKSCGVFQSYHQLQLAVCRCRAWRTGS
jgi:hypothetical protein